MNRIENSSMYESGTCECCNTVTMSAVGQIVSDKAHICDYVVRWSKDDFDHPVGIFIKSYQHPVLAGITVEYRFEENGFMIVNHDRFDWPKSFVQSDLVYFDREELMCKPDEKWVYDVLDLIWLADEHIPRKTEKDLA